MVSKKLVVVEGEKDIMVSHLVSFWYVEGGGEVQENPFQSFEVVNIQMVGPIGEVKTVEFPMASLKGTQIVIKNGHPEGWGRILELPVNKDHTGLRYNSQNLRKQSPIVVEGQMPPFSDFFSSVRHLRDDHVYVMEEDGIDEEEGLVYKKIEG